jgi:hypothetical protein
MQALALVEGLAKQPSNHRRQMFTARPEGAAWSGS